MRGFHPRYILLLHTLLLCVLCLGCAAPHGIPRQPHAAASSPESARNSIVAITAILHAPALEHAPLATLDGPQLAAAVQSATRAAGAGFAIAPRGYILTAHHVITDAASIWVTTTAGTVHHATLVAAHPQLDLALLHADRLDLPPIPFASHPLAPGDTVFTYGNPAGRATAGQLIPATGQITELNCDLPRLSQREHRQYRGLIQSLMPLAPGHSGGPLLNAEGQVAGMNAAAVLPTSANPALGYAFPATPQWLAQVRDLIPAAP